MKNASQRQTPFSHTRCPCSPTCRNLAGAVLKQLPIYFHGSISLQEIEEALHSKGIHLRDDGRGRFLAERVPHFLTHAANAVSEQAAAPRAMRLVGRK